MFVAGMKELPEMAEADLLMCSVAREEFES
jgi:hypothetical protein